jgi:hypothetical protein
MKTLRSGSGPTSATVLSLAQSLHDQFPEPLHILTGLTLATGQGTLTILDLVILSQMAAFVGIDAERRQPTLIEPRAAAELLAAVIQQHRLMPEPLPVYAFWLGRNSPAGDNSPIVNDLASAGNFIQLANQQESRLQWPLLTSLAQRLQELDAQPQVAPRRQTPPLRRALRHITGLPGRVDAGLQEFIRHPSILHGRKPVQPADVNRYLERAMLDRNSMLEDVDYAKVVPNEYVVKLNADNYERHYRPIEQQVTNQWQERLLEMLNTANGRMGRKEYKFAGPVRVAIRPQAGVAPGEVRIESRINPGAARTAGTYGQFCLQLEPNGPRWPLREGVLTIGRSRENDVYLEDPTIQEKRLISSRHAYLVVEGDQVSLFDGAPSGKSSTNGTYVNGRRISTAGQELSDGDTIILAALDPKNPRPDTPGVATFAFHVNCP